MFGTADVFVGVDDHALIEAITSRARAEARAAAGRLAAIAELVTRRCDDQDGRELWACDGWDAAAAEISAALTIGRRESSRQMSIAMTLRDRLPKVAALLAAGTITTRTVELICWRTRLIDSQDVLALVDAALAGAVTRWGPLPQNTLIAAIDGWIATFDPVAVIRSRSAARSRTVEFGKPEDTTGVTSLWGALMSTDAAALKRRLTEMARQVCADDPRTLGQRRADALGVLATHGDRLSCHCANPDCPAAGADTRANAVIIHVLTDTAPAPLADPELDTRATTPQPMSTVTLPVGYLLDGQVLPPVMLADLVARGATVRPVAAAGELGVVERYRPSAAQEQFVRMRDMTCTAPGCTHPANACDLDHTIPWPTGPTHPANLNAKCRNHHLLKTFYGGPGGWHDQQHPDGTLTWTTPTGHTYRNTPGARILFPDKTFHTPPPAIRPTDTTPPQTQQGRNAMMPTRRHTRTQNHAARITRERKLNQQNLTRWARQAPDPTSTEPTPLEARTRDHPPETDPPPF